MRPSTASGDLNAIRCAASAFATTMRPSGPSMTSPCDMVFSARLKRCAMRSPFFSSEIAVNSTSRTVSAKLWMASRNGADRRPSTT